MITDTDVCRDGVKLGSRPRVSFIPTELEEMIFILSVAVKTES